MKTKRVTLIFALFIIVKLISVTAFASDWPQFLGELNRQGLSDGFGAVRGSDLSLRWEKSTGNTWTDVPGAPIVVGEYVYYYSSEHIRKLKLSTGEEVASARVYGAPINQFFVNIAYGDGKIFVPCQKDNLDDGIDIKGCFFRVYSAETLKQLYVTESVGTGQMQSPIMYNDGYFVTGVYGRNGIYACFTSEDEDPSRTDEVKKMKWSVSSQGKYGFSFNGATFVGDYCYFGCNNIVNVVNCKNGEVNMFSIGDGYRISSAIIYNEDIRRLYVTSNHPDNHAAVFSYELGEYGVPVESSACKWISAAEGGGTQSTPVIYKGRLYLGGGGHTMGSNEPFHVLDAVTLEEIYSVPVLTKGSAAVSTAYANEGNNWQVYIYVVPYSPNADGFSELWIISDGQGQTEARYETIENIGRSQYCSQSLALASDGSLIWYNDGGYLYCYENKTASADNFVKHKIHQDLPISPLCGIVSGTGALK